MKEELSGYLCATRNTIVFIYSLLFLFLLLVGILGTQGAHAGSVQPITPGFMTGCALSAAFGGLPNCRAPGLLATLLTVPDSILCLPACALPGDLLQHWSFCSHTPVVSGLEVQVNGVIFSYLICFYFSLKNLTISYEHLPLGK